MQTKFLTVLGLFTMALGAGGLNAQVEQKVKVEVKDLKAAEQHSPQIQVSGVKEKSWRPRNWCELEMTLDVKKTKTPGDTTTMVDALDVKFFIGLNSMDGNKKYYLLTGAMTLLNVPTKPGEKAICLAYVSPSTLRRLLGDGKTFSATSDIKAMAVEISHGGQVVGGYPVGQGKWWEDLSKFSVIDGEILPKSKTPFSSLWVDYDVDVKVK